MLTCSLFSYINYIEVYFSLLLISFVFFFVFLQCVICLSAKASMQTQPCGHRVVCRLCFVKTIQATVSQRTLPLRCVVCRTKILKLKQTTPPSRAPSTPSSGFFRPSSGSTSVTSSGHVTFRPQRSRSSVPGPIASIANTSSATGGVGVSACFGGAASAVCRTQATATGVVGSSPRHAPTATKLIQPLLIYPASSVPQSTSSATYHCGHHRLPPNHHHYHHGNQAQQQQLQQPRRVMAAWCGDGTSFDTLLEPVLTAAAPGVDIGVGNGGGSGPSTLTAGGHLHRRADVGEMERGRGRGVRVNGLVRVSGESSPVRRFASVSGNQSNSSSLSSRDRR